MKKEITSNQKEHRRQYDEEFKRSAVQMVNGGRSVAEVSRSLGINPNLLRKWHAGMRASTGAVEEPGEIERLRRYVRQLEMERDILKKALSIFSRST